MARALAGYHSLQMADKPLPDYYGLLEVHPRASALVIKKAFRALMAGGAHPDAGGADGHAKLLTEAYEILSDADKRQAYDLTLLMGPIAQAGSGAASQSPWGTAPGHGNAAAAGSASAPASGPGSAAVPGAAANGMPSPRRGAVFAGGLFLLGLGVGIAMPAAFDLIGGQREAGQALTTGAAEARYHLGAGEAYLKSGKNDEAEEHLRRAIALVPEDAAPLAALGDLLAETGRTDSAADAYHRAIAVAPDDPGLHTRLGLAYLMLRDSQAAQESLRKALAIDRAFRPALIALGQVYQEAGKFGAAQDAYGRAAAISGTDPDLRFRMGEVAAAMGDRDRAIEEWRACLALPGASRLLRERARRSLSALGAWYDEDTRGFRR